MTKDSLDKLARCLRLVQRNVIRNGIQIAEGRARSKSAQPSCQALFGFSVGDNAALLNGNLAARNAFEYCQSLMEPLVCPNIHEIGCRASVLSDQHWNSIAAYL
jgi:hypothetical protein